MGLTKLSILHIMLIFLNKDIFASYSNACKSLMQKQNGVKTEWVNNNVAIIHFPAAWHTEVMVNGMLYNPFGNYYREFESLEALKKSAMNRKAIIKFGIKVNNEELKKIEDFIKNNKTFFQSCVGGACRAINENTSMTIPFPFSQLPVFNLIYLTLLKISGLDFKRIESIEYIGRKEQLASLPLSFAMEGAVIASGILITFIAKEGIQQIFIPVIKQDDSTNILADPIEPIVP